MPPVRHARFTNSHFQAALKAAADNPHDQLARHRLADMIEAMGDENYLKHVRSYYGSRYRGPGDGRGGQVPLSAAEEAKVLRENIPNPEHDRMLVHGWHPTAQDAMQTAEWETALNMGYSIVPAKPPEGGAVYGWSLLHHPDEFDDEDDDPGELPDADTYDPREDGGRHYGDDRVERPRNYARARPELEPMMIEAIRNEPENELHWHRYADFLEQQGRPGEALFWRTSPDSLGNERIRFTERHPLSKPDDPPVAGFNFDWERGSDNDPNNTGMFMFRVSPDGKNLISSHLWTSRSKAKMVMKGLLDQGMHVYKVSSNRESSHPLHPDRTFERVMNASDPVEEPQQYAAYRAPAGGAVVRGTYYQGGKLIPDLEGEFANPPVQQTPPAQEAPMPSLRDRLKKKFAKKEPLVVSYARALKPVKYAQASPEHIEAGIKDLNSSDPLTRHRLADMLESVGRQHEAGILRSDRPVLVRNGVITGPRTGPRMNLTRRDRGVSYQTLFDQLHGGRSNRIGGNMTIEPGPDGDIHVLFHGNHVVTAHPNGDHTIWTRGYGHSPTTRNVIGRITGYGLTQQRHQLYYGDQPFQEGQRYRGLTPVTPAEGPAE